jgi:hypothetical protein
MVERGELLGRMIVTVEQRGHQDLNHAGRQQDADQAHRDRGGG